MGTEAYVTWCPDNFCVCCAVNDELEGSWFRLRGTLCVLCKPCLMRLVAGERMELKQLPYDECIKEMIA